MADGQSGVQSGVQASAGPPVSVRLSTEELMSAAMLGCRRNVESLSAGKRDAFGMKPGDAWRAHIEGAAGEMAAAKAIGAYWSMPINTYKKGGDVGCYQVRTRSKDDGEMIVRPHDRDADVFILVCGCAPDFTVFGWMHGREAKQTGYLKAPGGRPAAFFVPIADLHPIATLPKKDDPSGLPTGLLGAGGFCSQNPRGFCSQNPGGDPS